MSDNIAMPSPQSLALALIEAVLALASSSGAMSTVPPFVDHCRVGLRWVLPTLLHLLDDASDGPEWFRTYQAIDEAALLFELDVALNKPATSPLRTHGWLIKEPLLCALAMPMTYVDPPVHGALIAAALITRMKSPKVFTDIRWYKVGLELRRLAEEPRFGSGFAYVPPADLESLDSAAAIVKRLPDQGDTRDDDEVFSSTNGAQDTLIALGKLLRDSARIGVNADRPGVYGILRGMRGPRVEADGLEDCEDLRQYLYVSSQDEDAADGHRGNLPPRVFTRSPSLDQSEDEGDECDATDWASEAEADEPASDGDRWPIGSARVEIRLSPSATANERRAAIALADRPAERSQEDLDAGGEDLWIRAQRMDLGLAPLWWDAPKSSPYTKLSLVLVTVLGVGIRQLSRIALHSPRNRTQSGLRIYRCNGDITATLQVPLPTLAAPFAVSQCDPAWLHSSLERIVLPIHPTIAIWLAHTLIEVGARWKSDDNETSHLVKMPNHRWAHTIDEMAKRLATAHPGMRATAGNTMGMHLAALTQAGTTDPGLAGLVAPWLFKAASTQAIYTNVPMSQLARISINTQVKAWQALCGKKLDLPTPDIIPLEGRVGSRRCLTPEAVRKAHLLLKGDAKRAMQSVVRSGRDAASRINTAVLLTVFELSAGRGLRARRGLWRKGTTLSVGCNYWTFADKGRHLRSLPLDGVDHMGLSRLADTLRDAPHPDLGDEVRKSLAAAERTLRGENTGARSAPMGQLVLQKGKWLWRPVCMADLHNAWKAHGERISPAGLRYAARSVLAEGNYPPAAIDSLLGHHAWGREDFRPLRHSSGPLLRDTTMPLIHHLRNVFLNPLRSDE
jgi:hypothetical protein